MTPKEKADELYIHMLECVINPELTVLEIEAMAIQCALIAVDEILDGFRKLLPSSRGYWQQVRTEIENL
jgi:hypothetical protein